MTNQDWLTLAVTALYAALIIIAAIMFSADDIDF